MKRKNITYSLICAFLIVVICFQLYGCNTNAEPTDTLPTDAPTDAPTEDAPTEKITHMAITYATEDIVANPDVTKFDIQKFMYPIWESDTSYAEVAFVRENQDGIVEPIQLLYPVEEIISVRSYNLITLYEKDVDYKIVDGKIEIIREGAIPVLSYSGYYFPIYNEDAGNQMPAADNSGGAYIHKEITNSSKGMSEWMISVTYKHSTESIVTAPAAKTEKFSKLIQKLENGEEIDAIFYGDSITYGWAASGAPMIGKIPRCPIYPQLVTRYISQNYGCYVSENNLSVSGKTAAWAADLSRVKVLYDANPDLVILAFGMNDGCGTAPSDYIRNINYIVNKISKKSPDTCIVVVGTMLPNELVGFTPGNSILKYQAEYAEYLREAEKSWTNAAFADVTTVHQQMLEAKSYQDTTSSNTNHPNDYMHRVYAQVIFQTIFGDYT